MKNYKKLGIIQSKGRLINEANSHYRSPFQRDRDRIIHSTAFRRLKHKTQVFVNTEGDHYRTRITHSIEVAQIARTISRYLNLNDDLTETLSLAHDLGHTPFGHAGEDALNEAAQLLEGKNYSELKGNKYYNTKDKIRSELKTHGSVLKESESRSRSWTPRTKKDQDIQIKLLEETNKNKIKKVSV